MNKNDLIARISKKEKDIEKINKRIAKWSKGLRVEDIEACKGFEHVVYGSAPRGTSWRDYHGTREYQEVNTIYRNYINTHNDIPEADDWNKGPNIDELHIAYIDLGEANNTLDKYKFQLKTMEDEEKEEKLPILENFLNMWKEKATDWYKNNAKRYYELKMGWKEYKENKLNKYLETYPEPEDKYSKEHYNWDHAKYYYTKNLEIDYYTPINSLTYEITDITYDYLNDKKVITGYTVDNLHLEEALEKEKERKYKDLLNRVTAVVGTITNVDDLTIGCKDGELNGYIEGHEGKCRVQTISAGGYNIQCFHFRVLVTKM